MEETYIDVSIITQEVGVPTVTEEPLPPLEAVSTPCSYASIAKAS